MANWGEGGGKGRKILCASFCLESEILSYRKMCTDYCDTTLHVRYRMHFLCSVNLYTACLYFWARPPQHNRAAYTTSQSFDFLLASSSMRTHQSMENVPSWARSIRSSHICPQIITHYCLSSLKNFAFLSPSCPVQLFWPWQAFLCSARNLKCCADFFKKWFFVKP